MSEPVAAEIDWTPEGVTVIYASDTDWWSTKLGIRLKNYPESK